MCSDDTETEAAPAWNGVQRVPTRATEEDWEIVGKFEDLKIILVYTKNAVYSPWTCLSKTWTAKVGFLANAKIEGFNFKNKK